MNRFFSGLAVVMLFAFPLVVNASERLRADDARPNIIVILSDDMGYSDIGCYGGEISTPNLDRLARNGLRFTWFCNTGRCCPTRASLLTGLYPHQAGIGWMMEDEGLDGYRGDLNSHCRTIAEVLRPAGYATWAVGKWHVTPHVNPQNESQKYNWPLQRGFDRYYGIINGASSMWDPNSLVRDNQLITCLNDPGYQPSEPYHITDAISDNAVRFINEHDAPKPFFMYVAYTAAHWPMHARPRDIERYKGKYDAGYQPIREARLERMKRLGVIASSAELSPLAGDWGAVADREWEVACMEVYAAMIDQMDQGIGRIVSALEQQELLDNTLILFMQDNGGCAEDGGRGDQPSPRGDAPTLPVIDANTIHYFTSVPKQTRDGWPVRRGHVMPGPADTYIGYGRNWANVSNTPFREYKHWVHQGGIATPLIAHWPAGITDRNGICRQPSHLIDIMATCVDLAAADYPPEVDGRSVVPLQGRSLLPAFAGIPFERMLFWEHEGHRAVRDGKWKAVAKGRMKNRMLPVHWELYDLDADASELHDLSGQYPERLQLLSRAWEEWAQHAGVFPCPVR